MAVRKSLLGRSANFPTSAAASAGLASAASQARKGTYHAYFHLRIYFLKNESMRSGEPNSYYKLLLKNQVALAQLGDKPVSTQRSKTFHRCTYHIHAYVQGVVQGAAVSPHHCQLQYCTRSETLATLRMERPAYGSMCQR